MVSNPKKNFKSTLVKTLWFFFFIGWIALFGLFYGLANNSAGLFGQMPILEDLENPKASLASEVYTQDSVLLGKYFLENRTNIPFEDLSPIIMNTLKATEDIRFEAHSGIDVKGVASIPYYLIKGKRKGASTITQQLARNLYESSNDRFAGKLSKGKLKTIIVKLKEWITATKIEQSYTKEEIIAMYLNTVDFGSNAFGIKIAAQTYFGKDQKDLKYEEAAVLIGLLKATYNFNPKINPDKALVRRNTVLEQLEKYKYISKDSLDLLKESPIALNYLVENNSQGNATYFREETKKFLQEWCKEKGYDLYRDGLVVYTTIDSKMQEFAENAVNEHLKEHQRKFFAHWKGRNPWTVKNEEGKYEEVKDFLKTHIKRSYTYRLLKNKFGDDTLNIDKALREKKNMKVFTWDGEKDTLFSSFDSLAYYKHFLQTAHLFRSYKLHVHLLVPTHRFASL